MAILDKTEDEILNNFGIPSEKNTEGYYEEWSYYDFGRKPITVESASADGISQISVNPSYGSGTQNTGIYEGGVIYRRAGDYIKITFQNGRAVQWSTSGVDYTIEEIKSGGIILTFSAGFILLTGLALLLF